MKTMKSSKEILDPITDVFTGMDGGVSFAFLYHNIFPDFMKKAKEGNKKAKEVVESFELVSKVSIAVQNSKPE